MDTRGMGTPAMIAIIAIAIVVAGAAYYGLKPESEKMMEQGEAMMEEGEKMMKDGEAMMEEGEKMMKDGEVMMKKDGGAMVDDAMVAHGGDYQGDVLAEGKGGAILLDFNKDDYEKAVNSGKLVTLYFYANWCPVCKAEFPLMQQAFSELDADVIGFRINYNDNQTDSDEKALAREFGVGYQHTKVFVKNGKRILKSPEGWDKSRYLTEITNAL